MRLVSANELTITVFYEQVDVRKIIKQSQPLANIDRTLKKGSMQRMLRG